MSKTREDELIDLTRQLVDAIAAADWAAYERLCDPTLSAFEPEGRGQQIAGLEFHRFYFNLGAAKTPRQTTIVSPKVRVMGDVAVVSYVRLVQSAAEGAGPTTSVFEETRVWQMQEGRWRHVHFHRSRPS
jgi:calcium/calmodulin-dependent protein kinase (CaM kinase) II